MSTAKTPKRETPRSLDAEVPFDYRAAFDRNIGWLTEWEQQELRNRTVAIAGLGGVGFVHAITLARLGVGGFRISDMDRFDLANLNRQSGAFMSTMGQEKAIVAARTIRDINPELRLEVFGQGVSDRNVDSFLSGVDLFVDGLDFFAADIRRKVFARCAELGIPAITAAPIGFGTSYLIFMPGGMTFEDYFRLEGLSEDRQYVAFAVGLTPKGFHRSYLVDPSRIDLAHRRGPSTAAAVQLCAGVVGAEAVKLLLGRGKVYTAPYYHQFDAYSGTCHRGRLPFGNAGPLQRLKRQIGYRAFARLSRRARPVEEPAGGSDIERILDLARWAPSGDNTQPWRFEIVDDGRVIVHLRVANETENVYEYADGQPTWLAAGFLLETIRLAASRYGRAMHWNYLGGERSDHRIAVDVPRAPSILEDPLTPYITIRSVNRGRYRLERLSAAQRAELENALGGELEIRWYETLAERWRMARLIARATDIRLRLRQAYEVHRRILDWDRRFSPDGVPVAAVGLDPLTTRMMRWLMGDWRRMDFMNRFLAGTAIARFELDLIPGVFSAAYFTVTWKSPLSAEERLPSLLRAGEQLQRFWLTATHMGLAMQPALAPLCFAHHGRSQIADLSSEQVESLKRVQKFSEYAASFIPDLGSVVFLGRIGIPGRMAAGARSVRQQATLLAADRNQK